MGVSGIVPSFTEGDALVHRECRECSQNLPAEATHCPECDREPVRNVREPM